MENTEKLICHENARPRSKWFKRPIFEGKPERWRIGTQRGLVAGERYFSDIENGERER